MLTCLTDMHGRAVRYLRLSITDRCNLRCLYCCNASQYQKFISHPDVLRYEELLRIVRLMSARGVEKVRLTGGEPFARKGCTEFMGMLRAEFPHLDVRVTTNGTLLYDHIPALARMKIGAVNLSLDTFDADRFARITGTDALHTVLKALEGLLSAGIRVKINAVGLKGVNDADLPEFLRLAAKEPVDVRFIEFMPMGAETCWSEKHFWSAEDILAQARSLATLQPVERVQARSGPARMFTLVGGKGRFGLITPLSNHFCASCIRLRITPEGAVRTCLFDDKEYPLREILRDPSQGDAALMAALEQAITHKPVGVELLRQRGLMAVAQKGMSKIGG
jgi:GTP 3',8-cyclase